MKRLLRTPHYHCCPVRPLLDDDGWKNIGDSEIVADRRELVNGEPAEIVGADDDEVLQPGEPLPEPYVPSKAEVAAHNLTHLSSRSWCPHCVAARRPYSHHRRQPKSSQSKMPLLVAYYAQARDSQDKELLAMCIVAYIQPRPSWPMVFSLRGPSRMPLPAMPLS